MNKIPYGETWTYSELAQQSKSAARAVGGACGANPIPLIQPCHRVIASNGAVGGFSGKGGLKTKEILLKIERPSRRLT
jgi:methylated-DNA-[protein]-cysteine S-methyltransferase